jgi:hypothetical protein
MNRMMTILLLTLFSINAEASNDIFKKLPKEEYAWQALHLVDVVQTYKIASQPDRFYEKNHILGRHPSKTDVIVWGVATSVVHAALIYHMQEQNVDPRFIKFVQYVSITHKGVMVYKNFKLGLP